MVNLKDIESKWQEAWEKERVYEPEIDDKKPKFFLTVPYPYMNGLLHLGSAFTFTRGDIIARYKRLRGYNVLWPQGWHITGAPIVANALRLKEGDEKIKRDLELQRIPKEDWEKLKTPEGWALYFVEKNREAFKKFGFSIDWRREFYTSYLNPWYSKFVEWQYFKLKEKGLVFKGKHPVVWDPKVESVIGDHDRPDEYAGIGIVEGYIIKFKFEEYVLPCFTLRPETVYGVTNIWINPKANYGIYRVNGELWILPKTIVVEELKAQGFNVEFIKDISNEKLLGKNAINLVTNEEVPVLPAEFVDPEIGTGVVMSVPAHAPYDYRALKDIEEEKFFSEFKKLAIECLNKIKVLFNLEGYEVPAKEFVEKFKIESQKDREKLDKATQELYSKEFYNASLSEIYGKYSGKKIFEVKDQIAQEFVERNIALRYYTLPIRFKSRYGGTCIVKIVEDQWFLKYSDPEWKKLARKCVNKMNFIPESVRKDFEKTIDWLKDWACAHKKELGTPLPWDKKWIIESLSDSTIYMAYYTIAHLIKKIPPEKIESDLFDYVFLGKGNEEELVKKYGEVVKSMRKEFLYWYPVDLRSSGKDLIPNHLTFFIFHHVAIFPEDLWPRAIAINGHVLMDGKKMSKSLGNIIPMLYAIEDNSVDALRFLLAYSGESGIDDANIEFSKIKEVEKEIKSWYEFCVNNFGKGRDEKTLVDEWFLNALNKKMKEAEKLYEEMMFKTLLVKCYYELQNLWKWYLKRTNNEPCKECVNKFIEYQTLILYPIIPHICSEILEKIRGKEFALNPKWPESLDYDEKLEKLENLVRNLELDIRELLNLLRAKGLKEIREIKLIVASRKKYEVAQWLGKVSKEKDFREIMKEVSSKGFDVKLIQKMLKDKNILNNLTTQGDEVNYLRSSIDYFKGVFGVNIIVEIEEESSEEKKKVALPSKPAIVVK